MFRLSRACKLLLARSARSSAERAICLPLHRPMRPSPREIAAAHNLHINRNSEFHQGGESERWNQDRDWTRTGTVEFEDEKRDRFRGYVRELFGYRKFLFTDRFSFGLHVSQTDFDHGFMISDPQRQLSDVIEENMVVEVSVVCLYGHSSVVDPLVYSLFNFRGFTPFAVVPTTVFYVPENIYEDPK
ncbi:hypothetical protein EVAR_16708_1 [Eumeta japonica]|uniref:Uncharacterized protein n=1 Tax=Eumeta variegata TaxID=151549 RepID=A0A4C1V4G1_EUMVA|nr:hypothetical protein EVAR_16708_1 [Eumeta japonica]